MIVTLTPNVGFSEHALADVVYQNIDSVGFQDAEDYVDSYVDDDGPRILLLARSYYSAILIERVESN